MAKIINNVYYKYTEKEIKSWDKYPREFRLLPCHFFKEKTDSSIIKNLSPDIFETNHLLTPLQSTLGKKRRKTSPKRNVEWGEIYVLNAIGTSLFKIGHSTNFKRRFQDLSAASPLPLIVFKYGLCDNPNILENHIHDIFENKYFKNEWFSLDENDLIELEDIFNTYFES